MFKMCKNDLNKKTMRNTLTGYFIRNTVQLLANANGKSAHMEAAWCN